MPRSDLLVELVRAGARGEHERFRKAVEALVADERTKQHHVLANQLAQHLDMQIPRPHSTNGFASNHETAPGRLSFAEVTPRRSLEDLVLPTSVRESCDELVEEQHRADLLRSHNVEPRNRVLLAGPPGNGKTSLAEALASELSVPLLVVRYEALIASYLGETAVRMAQLFEQVRTRRCVLFFDEFDVVGKERGDVHETGEIKRVVSSLLLQIDALPSYVVVVAATNHPELLDRAVWRRFQLRLELPAPAPAQLQEWLGLMERRFGTALKLNADTVLKQIGRVSYAELEQLATDVQRRVVLGGPEADVRRIVSDRLRHWRARYRAEGLSRKRR